MQFVDPISWDDALHMIGDKSPIGAALSSSEWSDVPVALRQRAMFSANLENVRFLQRAQDGLGDFLAASKKTTDDGETMLKTGSRSAFIDQMREFALKEGMGPLDPEDAGGLKDITSERRLGLVFDTQTTQAGSYAFYKQGQNADVINEFPAMRFIRVVDVKEPRQSHEQYQDQVYLKNDPIWSTRINQDFNVPWAPFGWGCGHDTEDVDRDESDKMGLTQPDERIEPETKHFNENLQASALNLAPELLQKLYEAFGDKIEIGDDVIRWTGQDEEEPEVQSQLEKNLAAEEDLLRQRRGTEKLVALDQGGKVIYQREGFKSSVRPEPGQVPEDSIVTHNHPSGAGFSSEDIASAVRLNLSQVRAVGNRQGNFTYVLDRPPGGWPKDAAARYTALLARWRQIDILKVKAGNMTAEEMYMDVTLNALKELAAEIKTTYERF